MRFFGADAKQARISAAVAMTAVSYVNLIIFFIVGVVRLRCSKVMDSFTMKTA